MSERTEMKCVRCGSFSSTRTCWHCGNQPDAVTYAEVERLKALLGTAREQAIQECIDLAKHISAPWPSPTADEIIKAMEAL